MSRSKLQPEACPPQIEHPQRDPLNPTRAPYRKAHGRCGQARTKVLTAAKISPKTRLALLGAAFQEDQAGRPMDWIPHQLATWGGASPRTVYRDIPELLAQSLIQLVTPGNRGIRRGEGKASVYRLGPAFPEWAGFTSARSRHESPKPVRVTKCPSPGELRSPEESPSDSLHREPAPPPPVAKARTSARKGRELPAAEREARERIRGFLVSVKASPKAIGAVMGQGRTTWSTWSKALKVAEDALKVMELRGEGPKGIHEPHKFLTKAILQPRLGLSLRTTIRRWRGRCRAEAKAQEATAKAQEDQVREAMGEEAYQEAQRAARAAALEAKRFRAEAEKASEAEELRLAQRKKRAEAAAATAWAAIMAEAEGVFLQLDQVEAQRLAAWRETCTPGEWAGAVFRRAGLDEHFLGLTKQYHALSRKAQRVA